jgi:acyl-CoA reductase-like NAD-dependent aldehyde dehydrogenase
VLPVLSFLSIDEVIERANDSVYGLEGTIWSPHPQRALYVALKIDTGIVWVNSHMSAHPDVAIGGAEQSGIGVEVGLEGRIYAAARRLCRRMTFGR